VTIVPPFDTAEDDKVDEMALAVPGRGPRDEVSTADRRRANTPSRDIAMARTVTMMRRRRRRMGLVRIDIDVARAGRGARWHAATGVLVDSGAEITWLDGDLLRDAGVTVFKRDQPFVMANGQQITRDVGIAIVRHGEFKTVDEVVFARPGDLRLLGARTLEGFNAVVDVRRKRLVAAGPMPAAVA
jgi:predicted aspartyl protease